MPTEDKDMLRRHYLAQRQSLSPEQRLLFNQAICQHSTQIINNYENIAGYVSINGEVDIIAIMHYIIENDKHYCLPYTAGKQQMSFRHWHPDLPLAPDSNNIPAPTSDKNTIPDLIFLPLLAFDHQGYRLGYGGGYYDHTLAKPEYNQAFRVGVAYACQQTEHLPSEPHDVRLHAIVTELGMTCF